MIGRGTEAALQRAAGAGRGKDQRWFAAGGTLGAVLASSCCILPLVLATLGVSGAWIGALTALEPYRLYFAGVAVVFLGLGFRRVYFRPATSCREGALCERPGTSSITKAALWFSTLLVMLALSVGWWAPLFY
jgi:mercuric ion transport protein